MAIGRVKCPICGTFFNREKIECVYINSRYYHLSCCSEDFIYTEKIFDFLKEIWGSCIKKKISKQIENIVKDNNYTIKQIYNDLVYFYEIKNSDRTTYKNTINIVPYIHDDAQKYYRLLQYRENKKEQVTKQLEESTPQEKIVMVGVQPKRKKIFFELEVEEG